jgi:hypothetical protein
MPKTNFSKVEEALAEGLKKISIEQYLAAAPSAKELAAAPLREMCATRKRLLRLLSTELDYLHKKGHPIYEKFKIEKEWIAQLLEKPESISTEEWEKVVQLKASLTEFKAGLDSRPPEEINEELVKKQAKKHLTKRFNVNDKWLPLK